MSSIALEWEKKLSPAREFLENSVTPFSDLLVRLVIAWTFFKSGWMKLNYYLDDNWDVVLYLFEEEHPVPFLPPEIAAVMGTAAEVCLPILLVFGLFGRLAALGLIGVTVVIISTGIASFTLPGQLQHLTWLALLSVIATRGPGTFSLDHLIFSARRLPS